MEYATRIEITFKSGDTIVYNQEEWDDYAYEGKAVLIKKKRRSRGHIQLRQHFLCRT